MQSSLTHAIWNSIRTRKTKKRFRRKLKSCARKWQRKREPSDSRMHTKQGAETSGKRDLSARSREASGKLLGRLAQSRCQDRSSVIIFMIVAIVTPAHGVPRHVSRDSSSQGVSSNTGSAEVNATENTRIGDFINRAREVGKCTSA